MTSRVVQPILFSVAKNLINSPLPEDRPPEAVSVDDNIKVKFNKHLYTPCVDQHCMEVNPMSTDA